jgi:hypothetical protein
MHHVQEQPIVSLPANTPKRPTSTPISNTLQTSDQRLRKEENENEK